MQLPFSLLFKNLQQNPTWDTFAIFSVTDSSLDAKDPNANLDFTLDMMGKLRNKYTIGGSWEGDKQDSYFVPNIKLDTICKMMAHSNQESFILGVKRKGENFIDQKKGEMFYDTFMYFRSDVEIGEEVDPTTYYQCKKEYGNDATYYVQILDRDAESYSMCYDEPNLKFFFRFFQSFNPKVEEFNTYIQPKEVFQAIGGMGNISEAIDSVRSILK